MRKYHFIYLSILFFFLNSTFSDSYVPKPTKLFNLLYEEDDWEVFDSSSSNLVSTKKIPGKDLFAVMVEKELTLPKNVLKDVIMDIKNYNQFLKSSGSMVSDEINRTPEYVDGYQFIPIRLPFFDNREYLFRIYPNGFKEDDSLSIVHWHLLRDQDHSQRKKGSNATYLNNGAGLWVAKNVAKDRTSFSYRIYIDPGGSLPNFLIDLINKTSVVNIFKDAIAEAQKRHRQKN